MKIKKTIRFVLILSLLSFCGCAQMYWYNPNKTLEQGITDCRECYYDSSKAVAPIGSGISAGMQAGFLLNSCMKARGYMQISEEILPSKLRKASVPIDTFNSMKVACK